MTVLAARPTARLTERLGARLVAVTGCLIYAGGVAWFLVAVDATPAYLTAWLPATVTAGTGVGMVFTSLSNAAVSDLPATAFGIGSAVNAAARQLGAVLGIALLIALVGEPTQAEALGAFGDGWRLTIATSLLAAAVAALIPRPASAFAA